MLEMGQWATPVPVSARRRSSSPLKWMPWAYQTSGPIQPRDSMYSKGRIPHRSRTKRSSSFVSHRWVWSRTPRSLARSADCRSSSSETLKGEQGASATIRMENRDGSW